MKKIEMLFYPTLPSATNTGMKFVLCEVTTDTGKVIHDWGLCEWLGTEWGNFEVPEGVTCKVIWWSNTLDPTVLLAEPSKIIKLGK